MRPTNLDIYIYLRKSRKDIELEAKEGGDTLERHRKFLMEIVKKEGHNLIKEPFEEVVSGEYIIERPKIQELLKEVEQGAVDAVLVMDFERLGRGDMYDMGSIYRAFSYSETLVLTPTDVIDPTSESAELLFGVKSIVSREELKSINKRLQNGRKSSAREGKFIARSAPYGYIKDKENLKLIPDPDTAPVVQTIFKLIADGKGRRQVAKHLEEDLKIPPPFRYQMWEDSSISYIIKNEAYLGRIIWGKTKTYKRNGKRITKKVPRDQWIIRENCHEPLIDLELFNKANESHTGRHRAPVQSSLQLSNPLAGILKCSICGRSLRQFRNNDRPNPQVRCFTRSCQPLQKGALIPLVYEKIVTSLEDILNSIEIEADLLKKKQSTISRIPVLEKRVQNTKAELVKLERQKNNLHDFLEQGIYNIETFMERQQNVIGRIKELEEMKQNLIKQIENEKEKELHYKDYLPKARTVLQQLNKAETAQEKNTLLKSIIEKIEYTRDKEWKKKDHFQLEIHLKI
ncbi:recombinase family protein [Shouchella clausii]|uniref:recombinase family protein n=1 Tax=Shouchella clausii TaxID=79880 RepID=UPI00289D4FB8|nr:recombinase family protein [Shouchella clausii]